MKKTIKVIIATLTIGAALATTAFASTSNTQSDKESTESVKFFVGQGPKQNRNDDYKTNRLAIIKSLEESNASSITTALVTFNSFQTEKEVPDFAKNNSLVIKRVWFSIPGESGKGFVEVQNNDIQSSLQNFLQRFEKKAPNGKGKTDLENFKKNGFSIFALTVEGSNQSLFRASQVSKIKLVDPFYTAEAEKAKQAGKKVTYIESPEKPDGTE